MIITLDKCPICGSNELQVIKRRVDGDNEIYIYKCLSCDSTVFGKVKTESETIIVRETKEEMNPKDIYNKCIKSILEIYIDIDNGISAGTGVILKDGYVITNAHVLKCLSNKKKDITQLATCVGNFVKSDKQINLDIVAIDKDMDLALLEIENVEDYEEMAVCVDKVENAEKIYAIGNSKGQGISIVDGIVSDNERKINGNKYIMFSAPVNEGNSGGALINSKGELIGIVTLRRSDAISMNYAIPIDFVYRFVEENI